MNIFQNHQELINNFKNFSNVTGLQIRFIQSNMEENEVINQVSKPYPFLDEFKALNITPNKALDFVITDFFEKYIFVQMNRNFFNLLIGPYLSKMPSLLEMQTILKTNNLIDQTSELEKYYLKMRVINHDNESSILSHLNTILPDDSDEITESQMLKIEYRKIDFSHYNYFDEIMFYRRFFQGRSTEEEYQAYTSLTVGHLSDDLLRNSKNLILIASGILERQSIEVGLSPSTSLLLGDVLQRKIESATNVQALSNYFHQALSDFKKAYDLEKKDHYTKKVHEAIKFIDRNLSNPLNLKDIANYANVSPEHLSRTFKKETGVNIKDYILNERLSEAKILLIHTNHTLQEISDILGFNSKSYFIRVFRKHVGSTPKLFRDTHSGH